MRATRLQFPRAEDGPAGAASSGQQFVRPSRVGAKLGRPWAWNNSERLGANEDLWADPAAQSGTDEVAPADCSRQAALGRTLALAGLLIVTAISIGAAWSGHSGVAQLSQRFWTLQSAWRLMVLDPTTDCLFAADERGGLNRLDLQSGQADHWGRPGRSPDPIRALALSPNGGTLATSNGDGSIRLHETTTGQVRQQIDPPLAGNGRVAPAVTSLAYHPDGRSLVAGSADGAIAVLNAADGRPRREVTRVASAITQLAFDPSGRVMVAASADGTIRLADGATLKTLRRLWVASTPVRHLCLAPDGRTLALSLKPAWNRFEGQILLLDLDRPGAPPRVLGASNHDTLAFTPDGRSLVAAGFSTTLRQWDLATGRLVATGTGHRGYINRVLVLPDGRRALTAGEDSQLGLFDLHPLGSPTDPNTPT